MIKVCKIRFYPNQTQIDLIQGTFGTVRWIKNKYIETNINYYETQHKFLSGYDFSKYINHIKKKDPDYYWIREYSSKAIKQAIMEEETAFKKFFKKKNGFPKFKSRKKLYQESFYFIKDSIHFNTNKKNIIKIPILGNIRITEKKYLPNESLVMSGRVIYKNDKYWVSFSYEDDIKEIDINNKLHLGIDVGIEKYATIYFSDNQCKIFNHFIKTDKYKAVYNKIQKLQKIISNKAEINYGKLLNKYLDTHNGELPNLENQNKMKGESYKSSSIRQLRKRIRKLYEKLDNIAINSINKLVSKIVTRTKPQSITIENLSIQNMLSNDANHSLHKYISQSKFYYFRNKLIQKCHEYNIEIRLADRYFASSKKCCICSKKNKNLSLNDRVYYCKYCGNNIDRDLNAAINLCKLRKNKYNIV